MDFLGSKNWHLSQVHFFDQLPPEVMARIEKRLRYRSYERGEVLCQPDDHTQVLFFLTQGRVKQYTLSNEGQERILHIFKAGDAFGGLLLGNHRELLPWTQALDDCTVVEVNRQTFDSFVQEAPEVCFRLFEFLADHHAEDIHRFERFLHLKAGGRLVMTLLDYAQRTQLFDDHEVLEIDPPFTQEELANQIGVARTTVAELMTELRNLDILAGKGREVLIHKGRALQYLESN
jgi:CRP-like cAMP-binding protein